MTVLTHTLCDANTNAQVLLVAANTELHTHCLPSLGEFGFEEIGHRMSIIWIRVALQTLLVARWRIDEIAC